MATESGYYLRVLSEASRDIEARHIVAGVLKDLVEDVQAWDCQTALFRARLSVEEKSYQLKVGNARAVLLEQENARMHAQVREIQGKAAAVRSLLVEDVSDLLGSSRERVSLRQKVAFYKQRAELLQAEVESAAEVAAAAAEEGYFSPPVSPPRRSLMPRNSPKAGAGTASASGDLGDAAAGTGVSLLGDNADSETVTGSVEDSTTTTAAVAAAAAAAAVVVVPYQKPASLLDLEDAAVLCIFSFLAANEVLGIAQICRGTFKRVDKIFGIGSTAIKPEWPDCVITVEEAAITEAAGKVKAEAEAAAAPVTVAAAAAVAPVEGGLSRSVASAMTEKLNEAEMGAIIRMMESMRKQGTELAELKQRESELTASFKSCDEEREFYAKKLREAETSLKGSVVECASLRKQGATDAEVITYMDARGLELGGENASLRLRCERLEAGLDLQRGSHEHVEQRLRVELEDGSRALEGLEATYKTQKKVLVKEVKSLRNTVASITRELHQYKSQVLAVRETLDDRYR